MRAENGLLKWTGIVLGVLGALFIVLGIYFVWYAHSAAWVETPAVIRSVKVRAAVHSAGDTVRRNNTYFPQISYEYTVDEKQYSSNKWMLRTEHESYVQRDEALKASLQYRNGETITAYYNREDPKVAVLKPGADIADYISLLMGLLFGLTGGLLYKFRFQTLPVNTAS